MNVNKSLCLHSKTNHISFGLSTVQDKLSYALVPAYFTYPFIFIIFKRSNHSNVKNIVQWKKCHLKSERSLWICVSRCVVSQTDFTAVMEIYMYDFKYYTPHKNLKCKYEIKYEMAPLSNNHNNANRPHIVLYPCIQIIICNIRHFLIHVFHINTPVSEDTMFLCIKICT